MRNSICGFTVLLLASGCGLVSGDLGVQTGRPNPGNELRGLDVSYRAFDDSFFGGADAKAFKLHIRNHSGAAINNVSVVIDGEFRAPLGTIIYHDYSEPSSRSFGRDELHTGEDVSFLFSHDTSNHSIFENGAGIALDRRVLPKKISIKSDEGLAEWEFQPK